MSTAKSSSKKRKRESNASEGVTFKLSETSRSPVGPLLVSYPALHPPPSTAFDCYRSKQSEEKTKIQGKKQKEGELHEENMLVVGESANMEFISNTTETEKIIDSAGCQYIIAVHNRRTNTLSMLPAAKHPHIITRSVKALKSIPPSAAPTAQFREAKTALGDTFGTKKAKANIRAQERNRVDVSAMEGVMDHLMEGIDKGATGLLTQDEAKSAADSNRLIPPFDGEATDPAEVYPLHDIISEIEWKTLSVSAFDQAGSDRERIALLPFKSSNWINSHVNETKGETPKTKKKDLKILLYISAIFAFRHVFNYNQKGVDKDTISEKLNNVPSIVVDSLLTRFTETSRNSASHIFTSTTKTKLLTYAFALCLKIDNFATDTVVLAHDLSMPVTQINQLFKSLGCKIALIGERERTRLGLPDSSANTKRAILNAPVTFPKPRTLKKRG